MNRSIISGFLATEIEVKTISDKFRVCNFSIPYNETYGENKVTHWINCKAINQTADFIAKYFKKGSGIEVEGKLKTDTWEKDGVKHTLTYIQVDNVGFPPVKKEPTAPAQDNKVSTQVEPEISKDQDLPF